jgi:hypothetical protein
MCPWFGISYVHQSRGELFNGKIALNYIASHDDMLSIARVE